MNLTSAAPVAAHGGPRPLRSPVPQPAPVPESRPVTGSRLRGWLRSGPIAGVRVSVIVPVYNAMPYLPELLASLDDQGLPGRQLQVIIVDDGSTDGSTTCLDTYADRHPAAVVLHQPNSGWPGQPRNRALDLAAGRWVFFADADDYLAPGALSDLADFGDRLEAGVVIPKVKRCGTRQGGKFHTTIEDLSKRQAFRTFTPHKLIRRDLIEHNGLRFVEGKVRLEDGIFLSRCYLMADRISVLADRDLYYFRGRDDGQNISAQRIEPERYTASLQAIVQNVNTLSPGAKTAGRLIAQVIRRKCLGAYTPDRFPRYSPAWQERWLLAHADFLSRNLSPETQAALTEPELGQCRLIMSRDRSAVQAAALGPAGVA